MQKMHCAFQRTCGYIQKDANIENSYLSGNSLSSKGYEMSSLVQRSADNRCAVLPFLALESNGRWGIVVLPMQSDHAMLVRSKSWVNMDGTHIVSPSACSFKHDQHKGQWGPTLDGTRSAKLHPARSSSGSYIQRQFSNKNSPNKASRWSTFPANSYQNLRNSKSSIVHPGGCNATELSDVNLNVSKKEKAEKTNSRKKGRKKGKTNKKSTGNTGSTELECTQESSSSETAGNKEVDHGIGLLPYPNALMGAPKEDGCSGNCLKGNHNGTISHSGKACTLGIDQVNTSDALVSSLPPSFNSTHHSENGIQIRDPWFSYRNDGLKDSIHFYNPYVKFFSETNDSLVLDSISLDPNSEGSSINDFNFRMYCEEIAGNDLSESTGCNAREVSLSLENMLNGVSEMHDHGKGTNCSMHEYKTGVRHFESLGNKNKQIGRVSRNTSFCRTSSVGNLHGHCGKENHHSVWQRVQRNVADECSSQLRRINPIRSQFSSGLKEAPVPRKPCHVGDADMLSKDDDESQKKVNVSQKLKRKASLRSNLKSNSYSSNDTQTKVCASVNTQKNGIKEIPVQLSGQKVMYVVSRSYFKTGYSNTGFQTGKAEFTFFRPIQDLQLCSNEVESSENVYATVSELSDQTMENSVTSLSRSCDSMDHPQPLEVQPSVNFQLLSGSEVAKADKETSGAEHSKQQASSGFVMQKWVPVGVKDSRLPSLSQPGSGSGSWTSGNMAKEKLVPDPLTAVSSMRVRATGMVQSSKTVIVPSQHEVHVRELNNQRICMSKETCKNCDAKKGLIHKVENISAFGNDSIELVSAVKDVYRAQLASKAIEMGTGGPVAEFERLLHSASPVICPSNEIVSCPTCSPDSLGASLCRHELPNISLRSLWQWYEKHGSYGLEVRVEDHENSKRLGIDRFTFRAYFVPYLSAVQLFRDCNVYPSKDDNGVSSTEAAKESSSSVGPLPIYSLLVPQSRAEDSLSSLGNSMCQSVRLLSCAECNSTMRPFDCTFSDNLELLFEYFESEQPQQRRPLFELIKELVRADGPSQCRAYGDPAMLDSVHLQDLHPKSWYSVAWYPIYMIPDGNFRAAFLTYHSFGHLVHRNSSFDSLHEDDCVISPVIGLQSYNVQGECWLKPKHSADNENAENLKMNPSVILTERLRTLEQTASLMAKASVVKGSQICVNRQPDYEFFFSRRRW